MPTLLEFSKIAGAPYFMLQGREILMATESRDRELGMHRKITRRDFLDGVAMAVGGAALAGPLAVARTSAAGGERLRTSGSGFNEAGGSGTTSLLQEDGKLLGYPPALSGLRGDQAQVFEFAHRLRDGQSFDSFGVFAEENETYDLVVVGAGISGLAAAYF